MLRIAFRLHLRLALLVSLITLLCTSAALAQERPFFVTYDHYLEAPGDLEVAISTTTGVPKDCASAYTAPWVELEYGVTGWWTSELYLEGVTTRHDGSGWTGWRLENRFRPLRGEHALNPVVYVEYERVNEASRIQKEIVGAGAIEYEPIAELRRTTANELEAKLILSSAVRGWTVAENVTFEKNLTEDEGVEFGYSVGAAHSLASVASGDSCRWCRERFLAGVEMYGGLGTSQELSLSNTRHYVAPVLSWQVGQRTIVRASPAIGLTKASDRYLFRASVSYEFRTR